MGVFDPSVSVARPEIVSKRGALVRTGNTVDVPSVFYPLSDTLKTVREEIDAPDAFDVYEVVESDDFGDIDLSGMTLDKVWKLAEIAESTDEPLTFCAWVGTKGGGRFIDLDTAKADFGRVWRGTFDTLADFADQWASDHNVPTELWPHVDWEALGSSLGIDYERVKTADGQIALFSQS